MEKKILKDASFIVKLVLILAIVIVVFMIVSKGSKALGRGELHPPDAAKNFAGENYEVVKTRLEEAGFSDIEVTALGDLKVGFLDKEGDVEEVSINGDTSFKKKSVFPKKAKVKISYHSFPEHLEDEK